MRRFVLAGSLLLLAFTLVSAPWGAGVAWSAPDRPANPAGGLAAAPMRVQQSSTDELAVDFPPFGTPGYTQWMGTISSAREFVSMPKQPLTGATLKVFYSYEYNGRSDSVLCSTADRCLVKPHGPQHLAGWQLGGEWAFLGTLSDVSSYGNGDYKDIGRVSGKAVRYRLGVPSGTLQESVAVGLDNSNGVRGDQLVHIVRTGELTFTLPAITTKKKLYFGLNDHPSAAMAIFGGRHVADRSPYRLAAYEKAAWWTSGKLRSPTSKAPKPPEPPVPVVVPMPVAADGYVALGDSYSSGEGLRPFQEGSNTAINTCHRSSKAYSQLVSPLPDVFVACSGQKTAAYFTPAMDGTEVPQRDVLNADVGLVTMTLGGNNLEWSSTLISCIKVQTQLTHATMYSDPAGCRKNLDEMPGRLSEMRSSLMTVYADALVQAKNAQIRVLNYPPLFPDRGTKTGGCRILRLNVPIPSPTGLQVVIANNVEKEFVQIQDEANFVVAQAVNWAQTYNSATSRLQLVDVTRNFGYAQGHTSSCGDTGRPKPWINSIKLESGELIDIGKDIKNERWDAVKTDLVNNIHKGSYHPTEEGQRQMYLALSGTLPTRWH